MAKANELPILICERAKRFSQRSCAGQQIPTEAEQRFVQFTENARLQ
jgi:hypothetical protein